MRRDMHLAIVPTVAVRCCKQNILNSYTAEIMRMQRPPKYLLGASTHLISVDMG